MQDNNTVELSEVYAVSIHGEIIECRLINGMESVLRWLFCLFYGAEAMDSVDRSGKALDSFTYKDEWEALTNDISNADCWEGCTEVPMYYFSMGLEVGYIAIQRVTNTTILACKDDVVDAGKLH